MQNEYKYWSFYAGVILLIVLFGFRNYFGYTIFYNETSAVVHFHAFVMTAWFLMLVIQPLLITKRYMRIHRLLGKASYILAPLIILSMILIIRVHQMKGIDTYMLYHNFFSIASFSFFYLTAMVNKKNVAYHARYIMITPLILFGPAAARIWMQFPVLNIVPHFVLFFIWVMLIGLLIYEKYHKKVYKPYAIALVYFVVFPPTQLFIPQTKAWEAIAGRILTVLI